MNGSRRTFIAAAAGLAGYLGFTRPTSAQKAETSQSHPGAGPTQKTKQLAAAVIAASGGDARLAAYNEAMEATWLAALQKALPDAKPEWTPVMLSVIRDGMKSWDAKMTDLNIEIYATKFTDAELSDMLAFYQTSGGRALVAQTPAIIREKATAGRKLAPEMVVGLVNATCARVNCE